MDIILLQNRSLTLSIGALLVMPCDSETKTSIYSPLK